MDKYRNCYMRVRTNQDYKCDEIPDGMAVLGMDNNGHVGTNNGWPMVGQPALYPFEQAKAIASAWNDAVGRDKRIEQLEQENDRLRKLAMHHTGLCEAAVDLEALRFKQETD